MRNMKDGVTPAMLLYGLAGTPQAIEAMEAHGQRKLVEANSLLPIKTNVPDDEITRKTGIIFGAKHDELFVNVTLPKGWELRATDHSMHSELFDADGDLRASIFYKAAFYDRRADIRWEKV